jgi:hypothetical protein
MNFEEFKLNYKNCKHFFISELKGMEDFDVALMVELMRATQHIKNLQALMRYLGPEGSDEDKNIEKEIEVEPQILMLLNLFSAQLREALKIIWKLSESIYFKRIIENLSDKEKFDVNFLIDLNSEFKSGKGFIAEVLGPMRDLMFHYQTDLAKNGAVSWVSRMKELELGRKPPFHSVDLEKLEFGPGHHFETSIYTDFLFTVLETRKIEMMWQRKVWETQEIFCRATKSIVGAVLENEGIPQREFDWALKYSHGFKSEI